MTDCLNSLSYQFSPYLLQNSLYNYCPWVHYILTHSCISTYIPKCSSVDILFLCTPPILQNSYEPRAQLVICDSSVHPCSAALCSTVRQNNMQDLQPQLDWENAKAIVGSNIIIFLLITSLHLVTFNLVTSVNNCILSSVDFQYFCYISSRDLQMWYVLV